MGLDQDEVVRILKLIEESKNFGELNLQMGDLKLIVRKSGSTGALQQLESVSTGISRSIPPEKASPGVSLQEDGIRGAQAPQKEISKTERLRADSQVEDGLIAIKSPMLGTFYRAPKPGAPPFVEVGSVVKVGDAVCIIEVMKLFSTTTAELGGRIARICAEDGQMVEYGQALFLLEPEAKMEKGLAA
jgi:acetyl-CoA carboxylase biotin carboxyl carrier protein